MMLGFIRSWLVLTWYRWSGYETVVPGWIQEWRGHVCAECRFFNEGTCGKCGCLIFAKAMLSSEKCPVGKWGRVKLRKK
jgi:hypothetical protein